MADVSLGEMAIKKSILSFPGIVSKSAVGLAKMMTVMVTVFEAADLTVSKE